MLSATKATVLVVEDDPVMRSMVRTALVGAGYAVVAVDDGLAALHRVELERPHAVVLDLGLPRLGGRDVQRELAARPDTSDIPIVVVSGADTSDLNPAHFACVLRKPVGPDMIVAAVDDSIRRKRRRGAPA